MVKEEVKQIVEQLPEDATWDDLMYEIYVKQKVEVAETAVAGGKVVSHQEARKRMGRA
ncbi:MAG: hypothetical protein AAF604_09655 [Acidobacteriota bacterium]